MPKLFRPKLTQAVTKAPSVPTRAKSPNVEVRVRCPSPAKPDGAPTTTEPTPQPPPRLSPVTSSSTDADLKTTEVSVSKSPKCTVVSPSNSHTAVDIDQSTCKKQKRKSQTQGPSDTKVVELFKTKKTRTIHPKPTSDPIPRPDQPLDRTTVSLRSLLNWVPANKPPPSYRQSRSNQSDHLDPVRESIVKTELSSTQSTIKHESSVQSPEKHSPDVSLDLLAPQLRLDANGNIVLDETSLLVSMPETAREDMSVRHVNEESGLFNVTYNSFRNRMDRRGRRWSPQETVRFYRALSTFGRDFYLMAALFPDRSRPELKRKFKNESRSNPYLVNQALRNRRTYDVTALLPLSDEDEDEVKDKGEEEGEEEIEEVEETKAKPANLVVQRRKRERLPQQPNASKCNKRPRSANSNQSESKKYDSIMETIDAVLAQYCQSPAAPCEVPPTECSNSTTSDPPASPDASCNLQPANCLGSTIQQMISQAKRRVELSVIQSTVSDAGEPETVSEPTPLDDNSTDTIHWSNTASVTTTVPVTMIPVEAVTEQPKIDILLTGRKLLNL